MKYKYYDDWSFKKAMSIASNDPFSGAIELKKYLDNYPLDYTSYPYYISTLIIIGNFELAKETIDYVQTIIDSDIYRKDEKREKIIKYSLLYSKLKLLCYEKKYEEAYKLYLTNSDSIKDFNIDRIIFFLKIRLGLSEDISIPERDVLPYFYRQTIDYQESDFIHHAKKHCADNPHKNEDEETEFVSGFPIEEVFNEIKKYIPSEKKLYPGFIDNVYVFRYDGCGTSKKGSVDYIKVFTFNDTNDFITMHPYIVGERLPYIDLNYMRKENNNNKVKRLSQIDKFNKKFGIK